MPGTNTMTIIRLDAGDVLLARSWAATIEATANVQAKPNYTGLMAPHRFLAGYLGELAVARWFAAVGILHQHRVYLNGRAGAAEFIVYADGKRAELEVKTAANPNHACLMFPAAQYQKAAFYVAARLEHLSDYALLSIQGWLPGDEAERLPINTSVPTPARSCRFSDLRPAVDLLLWLSPVRRVHSDVDAAVSAR